MPNTGIKKVLTLRKYVNGVATSITKPNTVGMPDYIAPYQDNISCPIPGASTSTTTTTTTESNNTTTTTTIASSVSYNNATSISVSNNLPGVNPKSQSVSGLITVVGDDAVLKATVYQPFNYGNIATVSLTINGSTISKSIQDVQGVTQTDGSITLQEGQYSYTLTATLNIINPMTSGVAQVSIIEI